MGLAVAIPTPLKTVAFAGLLFFLKKFAAKIPIQIHSHRNPILGDCFFERRPEQFL